MTIAAMIATLSSAKDFTIIIDAGHGGRDYGAIGNYSNEKDINLAVALEVGRLIKSELANTKVIYTRNNDTFVTLQGRAEIANKNKGDLFVSIHTNSVDKSSKNRTTVAGASVYTLGLNRSEDNLAVAMRENSVMKMEKDYSTSYEGFDPSSAESYIIFELSQNSYMDHSIKVAQAVQHQLTSYAKRNDHGVRQANFWVLLKTSMPSILVELDFICNPNQEDYLNSKEGQQTLSQAIFKGIQNYKSTVDKEMSALHNHKVDNKASNKATDKASDKASDKPKAQTDTTKKSTDSPKPEPKAPRTDNNKIIYAIQFMTSAKPIKEGSSEFKGLDKVKNYCDGKLIKYYYGEFDSQAAAAKELKKVRVLFGDAFIIKLQNGKRI